MKQTTRVNFTTITGKKPGSRTKPGELLEAKAERWLNDKIAEGWGLREVIPAGDARVHIVMVRREQA